MAKKRRKLTLVSVFYGGKTHSVFLYCELVNGRPVVSMDDINRMLSALGCHGRGVTFSIG